MKHILILSQKVQSTPNDHAENAIFWVRYCVKHEVNPKVAELGDAILKLIKTIKNRKK